MRELTVAQALSGAVEDDVMELVIEIEEFATVEEAVVVTFKVPLGPVAARLLLVVPNTLDPFEVDVVNEEPECTEETGNPEKPGKLGSTKLGRNHSRL